jgi:ATP-dependent DNA helicase PIF1
MERLNILIKSIFENESNVYISGVGGTGKSFLMRQLYEEAVRRGINCVLTSTTGISSMNIGGCTIHSWSGIVLPTKLPSDPEEFISKIVTRIKFRRYLYKKWANLKLLFLDEISLLGADYLDILDCVARRIRGVDLPLGGIQIVAGGDFCQLPAINSAFCFESPTWYEIRFKNYILTKAYRFDTQEWSDILQRARIGKLNNKDIDTLKKCINKKNTSDILPTVIYALRKDVDDINEISLDNLPGEIVEYFSDDILGQEDKYSESIQIIRQCTEEQTKVLDSQLNCKRNLKLKVGAQVMLICNLDISMGLCNGSRGIVIKLKEDCVVIKFKGKEFEFEQEIKSFDFKVEHQNEILVRRIIPLILGYSSTVHKLQGSSIDSGLISINNSIFSPAMAYVALSRVRSLDGLYLEQLKLDKIYPNKIALSFDEKLRKTGIMVDEI